MNRARRASRCSATSSRWSNDFKEYFLRHSQPVYENPSPGNKAGGLTTLEEKSLGAIQKGGRATVTRVLRYGEQVRDPRARAARVAGQRRRVVDGDGRERRDACCSSRRAAARRSASRCRRSRCRRTARSPRRSRTGSTSTRARCWTARRRWTQLEDDLFAFDARRGGGRALTNNERNGYREIAIWKEGVTLLDDRASDAVAAALRPDARGARRSSRCPRSLARRCPSASCSSAPARSCAGSSTTSSTRRTARDSSAAASS